MINGNSEIEGQRTITSNQIALYQRGNSIIEIYSKEGSEFLLLGGQPLNEPVFSYGPFVMNNEAQIRECVLNYNSGKMGDPAAVDK
jgi:redox-sensitive bicupin YhaK (pirin superfamily)